VEATVTPEQALELILDYQTRPNDYILDVYGQHLWQKQREIVDDIFKYRQVAVKTSNAVGKSHVAASIGHAFLDLHPASLVVTTAPTFRQVRDVLWRYFATTHKSARYTLGGHLTQTGLEYDTDWYAIGFSTKYPENFAGYHADHILVIADEAGGIEEQIFKGIKAITPNVNAHILYIGNPTNPIGTFKDLFDNPRVKTHTISAFDTPNFLHAGITNLEQLLEIMTPPAGVAPIDHNPFEATDWPIPQLISPEVVYERYHEWGVDSPAWQALVMGEFPSQSEQALIPVDLVSKAMQMSGVDEASGKTFAELSGWEIPDGPPEYGLDVARFGGDLNVLTPRRGGNVEAQNVWNKKGDEKLDLVETADRTLTLIDALDHNARLNIDDTGVGGGVSDYLRRRSTEEMGSGRPAHQYQLAKYNFSSKEYMQQPDKFHDITSELYWNLREWFYRKQICLPEDEKLFRELVGRRWAITVQGKIKVESKEDYKKRTGGRSPDRSDSLALAFAGGVRIASVLASSEQKKSSVRRPYTSGLRRGDRVW
jgi:phage terminase large subunit